MVREKWRDLRRITACKGRERERERERERGDGGEGGIKFCLILDTKERSNEAADQFGLRRLRSDDDREERVL
jgi:hypothetical protein